MVLSLQNQAQTAIEGAIGIRFDVSPAWKFYVEVLGVLVAEFQECSGLGMEREMEEVTEGGTNDFIWLLPKHIKHSSVVLKKGITYNRELWRWFRWGQFDGQVWGFNTVPGASMAISLLKRAGIVVPMGTSVSIVLGTVDGKVAKHWDLIGAIPIKWSAPDMKADSNEAAIETLEIRHQGIDLSLEMATPMAGFFGGGGGEDLSSPEANTYSNYWDMGRLEPSTTTPAQPAGPNFWDMAAYGPDTGAAPKNEGSDFWDMPNLDPSQPPPKGQAPFANFDFYDMTEDEAALGQPAPPAPKPAADNSFWDMK